MMLSRPNSNYQNRERGRHELNRQVLNSMRKGLLESNDREIESNKMVQIEGNEYGMISNR